MRAPLEVLPPPRKRPTRWLRGARAVRELIANPEDSAKAQEFSLAVGAVDEERRFQRFVDSPHAERLLREAPSLLDALSDRDRLSSLPEDSLGRAYQTYLDENGFQPGSLVFLRREVEERWRSAGDIGPRDAARTWFRDRTQMLHDVSHVVTGYGTDGIGEATLLVFELAHNRNRASALLVFGAVLEAWRHLGSIWLFYVRETWRRGRAARHLQGQAWEDLLPLPLQQVREIVGVAPPLVAHPGGLLRGDRDASGRIQLENH
jgi:ubiquinone biosynthesis protein COQ4